MARTWVVFDPTGYYRATNEAWDYQLTAKDFFRLFLTNPTTPTLLAANFFFPGPEADWILCKPRQFNGNWNYDTRLGDHVLRMVDWAFAGTISPYEAAPPQKVAGLTQTANRWIIVPYIPPGTASLDGTSYANIGAACDVDMPADAITAATCVFTPGGGGIPLYATPQLRYLLYPNPDNIMVWGFANICLLHWGMTLFVLRSPDGGKENWELLSISDITLGPATSNPVGTRIHVGGSGALQDDEFEPTTQIITVLQHGPSEIYVYNGLNLVAVVPLASEATIGDQPPIFLPGPYWIGGFPTKRLTYQCQIVGYEGCTTTGIFPPVFDLTSLNAPTQALQHNAVFLFHDEAGDVTFSEETTGFRHTAADSGEVAEYALLNDAGAKWASNGTNYKGSFRLALVPGNTADGGYLAPQFKLAEFHIPALLTARSRSELVLSDLQFETWMIEADSHDPDAYRLTIRLKPSAAAAFEAAGLHARDNYPVHIMEGASSPGTDIRAAGWVKEVLLDEERVAIGTVTDFSAYQVEARSLLLRADENWPQPPTIINPAGGGFVEHTYAVAKALVAARFDVTDTNSVRISGDPWSGTAIARLPGTWGNNVGGTNTQEHHAWAPGEDETKLDYVVRVGREWRDWLIYTRLDGLVWYHPNLVAELADGSARYFVSATIYRTSAEAVAAGAPAGQRYLAGVQRDVIQPLANVVIVNGTTLPPELPGPTLDRDLGSILNTSAENFVGEAKTRTLTTKFALRRAALNQLARIALRRWKRRKVIRSFRVPLAPWDLESDAPVDVGYVVTFAGRGTYVIRHIQVRLLARDKYMTRITGELVPSNAIEGVIVGGYPGLSLL